MTALITGASSGIGLELARVCAAHRHDVVLSARSADKLEALAAECRAAGVHAHVLPADLANRDAPRAIVERLRELRLDIDLLVNNAGYGLYGHFLGNALETELDMIQVNIVALTELTKRLLPPMVARKQGRVLNVASIAAFFPGPLMAVYYATKAYVLSFSEAIANELDGTGVTVTALCPGPTASGFQAAAKLELSKLVMGKNLPSSREVAEAGYDAMMAGKTVCVHGVTNKLTTLAPRFMPRRAMTKIVRAAQESRTKKSEGAGR